MAKSIAEIREADLARKNAARRQAAAVTIPKCRSTRRRNRLEKDTEKWLRWYLPHVFTDPFCEHHQAMIAAIDEAATYAADQAFAAPRGEAKTTIAECVALKCILTGVIPFAVIFAATASEARASLASIRQYIEESDRLKDDYPEVCVPVRHAAASPQRAHSMIVKLEGSSDEPTPARFQWSGDEISMPRVPGSRCSGAIIATRGLDSAVRGLKRGTIRPQLAIIDDPDTEDTANSADQANKLAKRIERAIAGLAPNGKRISRVMLTTLQNRTCASARFTDPKQKPSWSGRRFRFLLEPPTNIQLWDEYVDRRRRSQAAGDRYARAAHQMYLERRKEMDAGAVVCNPKSFDNRRLPDGSRMQVSPLQRYFDWVADNGLDSALAELQSDPRAEDEAAAALTRETLAGKLNGLDRGMVPAGCQHVAAYLDVHKEILYWVCSAWSDVFSGGPIDYGTWPRQGRAYFSQADPPVPLSSMYSGTEEAVILAGLEACVDHLLGMEFAREDGAVLRIGKLLVDARWKTELVLTFCRRHKFSAIVQAAMGEGLTAKKKPFSLYSPEPGMGDHWINRAKDGKRFVWIDTNEWKTRAAQRLALPRGTVGGWEIFGHDPREHELYFDHVTAEKCTDVTANGRTVREWEAKANRDNHWWDCTVGSAVGGSMLGARIPGQAAAKRSRRGRIIVTA